jgi:hypothetical protein
MQQGLMGVFGCRGWSSERIAMIHLVDGVFLPVAPVGLVLKFECRSELADSGGHAALKDFRLIAKYL